MGIKYGAIGKSVNQWKYANGEPSATVHSLRESEFGICDIGHNIKHAIHLGDLEDDFGTRL